MIAALSKGKSKYLRSLRRRKMRYQHKRFILEGEKIGLELIQNFPQSIEFLLTTASFVATHKLDTVFLSEKLILGSPADFKEHSELDNPSDLLIVAEMPIWEWPDQPNGKWVFLDGIQDPGNLGTIFRTLSWFGFQGLILGPGCVDPYNAKVIQSTMGGIFQMPHYFANLEEALTHLGNPKTLGLGMAGETINPAIFPDFGLLILGSEGQGVSAAVSAKIDQWLHIPKARDSKMESLNAGVALGIAAANWTTQ